MVDLSEDPLADLDSILAELAAVRVEPVARPDPEAEPGLVVQRRAVVVANKLDAPGAADVYELLLDQIAGRWPAIALSAADQQRLAALRRLLFERLEVVRVHTKAPGRQPDLSRPVVLPLGSTLDDLAEALRVPFSGRVTYARVWGSGKFDGQRVSHTYAPPGRRHRRALLVTGDLSGRWLPGRMSGEDYEAYFAARAASGQDVHGEANFLEGLGVHSVLDAGCGTGRVARELARRGLDVVGVDVDSDMLETARRHASNLDWRLGDLATIDLGRTFDAVVLAGNVMLFLAAGTEAAIVENLARHLLPGGLLVAGFQLDYGSLTLGGYDALARAAGLDLAERRASWDRNPWQPGGIYAVSVHRRDK